MSATMTRPKKRSRLAAGQKSDVQQVSNMEDHRMKDMPDCDVYYVPSFVSRELADEWYSGYQPKLKVYGREVIQSRKIAGKFLLLCLLLALTWSFLAYSTDPNLVVKYSGQVVDMKYEYPPLLRAVQDQVEERLGVKFNHVMLNLYEDGTVYIGNHRDNLENKVIASLSLGAPRTFIMTHDKWISSRSKSKTTKPAKVDTDIPIAKHKRKHSETSAAQEDESSPPDAPVLRKSWQLAPGSLVVMQGETQRNWKHEIPREPKVTMGRISLTFRQLDNS
ncbi:hypothetical protein CVT26_008908 [Gymnopilus dilepis]|uniref:Fe2OG dioxygenase domain-containing protein n=1 Tax=Gymnopilus dilepis TaxID=231916 RepID=A0A409YAU7_9AGAR|nr:hypothetical protein CVT26_008908 [Gymnopilus dilepis]